MVPTAFLGIHNSGLSLVAELLVLFLLVVWFALIYWTHADARRRTSDPMLVWCATAASACFPFVGTVVYMIVRPPEYIEDVRERELEMQAAEARLAELGYHLCPHCDYEVERDFLRCPNCMRKLKDPCQSCGKPLDPNWRVCPYCESEVGGMTQAPRRTRRRRDAGGEQAVGSAGGGYPERGGAPVAAERGGPSGGSGERGGTSSGFGDRGGSSGSGGRGGAAGFGDRSGASGSGFGERTGTPASGLAARDGAPASARRGRATT